MGFRIAKHDHVLFLITRPSDRLGLMESVAASLVENNGLLLAVAKPEVLPPLTSGLSLGQVGPRRITACPVRSDEHPVDWAEIRDSIDHEVESLQSHAGESSVMLLVDLAAVFGTCSATSEMMSAVYHFGREHASHGRPVVAFLTVDSLPRNLPTDFFAVHSAWVFGDGSSRTRSNELDLAAEQITLDVPEFRQRFLASSREGAEAIAQLVPQALKDIRNGVLLADRKLCIRYCSPRVCDLLGRTSDELMDKPLTVCIDGVDLVTVKHECGRLEPGSSRRAPFIASWRLSPGVYEPREVRIDALGSGHQTVGYIIVLSAVDPVRGARAVYEQLKEEKAGIPAGQRHEEAVVLSDEEEVSADLHGTQITRREHEVILLIIRGMTNKQISEHLNIAEVTVKKHLTGVYRKLRITSRRELMQSFARPGGVS